MTSPSRRRLFSRDGDVLSRARGRRRRLAGSRWSVVRAAASQSRLMEKDAAANCGVF